MPQVLREEELGHGAFRSPKDTSTPPLIKLMGAPALFDWVAGFDVEKKLSIKIPIKNQMGSESCGGQAGSYLIAILAAEITGIYDEVSAKAIYSQIKILPNGGCTEASLVNLLQNWGAVLEKIVKSYKSDGTTDEAFMQDNSWITPEINAMAKALEAYQPAIVPNDMESFACAIRDHLALIVAVDGENNGTWNTNEPQPPKIAVWGHFLCQAKAGTDTTGKWLGSPNSWGDCRVHDFQHPDGWQHFRQNWFDNGAPFIMTAYTLVLKNKITKNMNFLKEKNSPNVYLINETAKTKTMVVDMPTLNALNGVYTEVDSLAAYADAGTLVWTERIIN